MKRHTIHKTAFAIIAACAMSSCEVLWDSPYDMAPGYNIGINAGLISPPPAPLPPLPPTGNWNFGNWNFGTPPPIPALRPPQRPGTSIKPTAPPAGNNRPSTPGESGQRPGANVRPGRK